MSNIDANWSLYSYEPNRPAPIAFAIVLFIIAAYQVYQSFSKPAHTHPLCNTSILTSHHSPIPLA